MLICKCVSKNASNGCNKHNNNIRLVFSYLSGKEEFINRVFGADSVGAAEMNRYLGYPVMIRKRPTTDVHVVRTQIVHHQLQIVARVEQSAA